jgi:hypothetical protein
MHALPGSCTYPLRVRTKNVVIRHSEFLPEPTNQPTKRLTKGGSCSLIPDILSQRTCFVLPFESGRNEIERWLFVYLKTGNKFWDSRLA